MHEICELLKQLRSFSTTVIGQNLKTGRKKLPWVQRKPYPKMYRNRLLPPGRGGR